MIQFDPEFDEDMPDDSIWLRIAACALAGFAAFGVLGAVMYLWQ